MPHNKENITIITRDG